MTDGIDEPAPEQPPPDGPPPESHLPALPEVWPAGRELLDDEVKASRCTACGREWRVHRSMAGFRLRCRCNAWVHVPPDAVAVPEASTPPARVERTLSRRDAAGLVHVHADLGEVLNEDIPTSLPIAPGGLEHGNARSRARWTNLTLLELAGTLLAILGPQLLALILASGREAPLLMPFASLVSCAILIAMGAATGPYARLSLRRASLRDYALALGLAGGGFAAAMGYVEVLEHLLPESAFDDPLRDLLDRLGVPMAVFVVAIAPAIVEEIAFRGMLQGRLMALHGARIGFFLTAVTFMLCHMQPMVMPIHLGLGLVLGWLRERSGSVLPGMLMHCSYNAAVLLVSP